MTTTATSAAAEPVPWTQKGWIQRRRDASPRIDLLFSGIDGFVRHRTGRHVALLAHFGFLSVFPLLAAMTTILGYVLESNASLREDVVDSVLGNIPLIGQQLSSDPTSVQGNALVLVFGLATALWAGTKCFVAAQQAMNDIWEIPEAQRPNLPKTRLRALMAIGLVGLSQIGSITVNALVGISGVSWLNRVLLVLAGAAINVAVVAGAYRVLTARRLVLAQVLPGSIGAGLAFSVFQLLGTTIVQRSIASASAVYGNFAAVIALLSWMSLHAMAALLGVEVNAVLDRRRASRAA